MLVFVLYRDCIWQSCQNNKQDVRLCEEQGTEIRGSSNCYILWGQPEINSTNNNTERYRQKYSILIFMAPCSEKLQIKKWDEIHSHLRLIYNFKTTIKSYHVYLSKLKWQKNTALNRKCTFGHWDSYISGFSNNIQLPKQIDIYALQRSPPNKKVINSIKSFDLYALFLSSGKCTGK